ncbi:NAD(P)-binding protein [Hypomontagnella submonticulosa]|nr:NAD(P)-binding protein [Hypomontagnella submonticulosa]
MTSAVFNLPGVLLITGAAGTGIGAAVARAFTRSGCTKLAIADLKPLASTRDAILSINPQAEVFTREGDVSDESFITSFAADVATAFGRIDYVVTCAGVTSPEPARSHETSVAELERIGNTNWKGAWLTSRAALRQMLGQEPLGAHPGQRGAVVHIASNLGIVAVPGAGPYCASKAAVINMTRADAIDYSADRIRVNCVCPGVIETPLTTGSPEIIERVKPVVNMAPMRRMGKPEEVADAILFLCSNQASFIQGHALVVDGGYTIH